MKIKFIFATIIVAMLALTSCSKNERMPDGNDNSKNKSFFIQIGKPGATSRAEGADMSSATVVFSDGYLIFTSGDRISRVVKIVSGSPDADEVTVSKLQAGTVIEEIPATTKNVYLYGNLGSSIPAIASTAVEGGSLAGVEALVWTLSDIQNDDNNVAKVPVYGKGDVAPGADHPERLESKFNVGPIGSRLQIGEISCSDDRVTGLQLDGIYINGFYHSMNAGFTFQDTYLVDNGIDKTKYSANGYTGFSKMIDMLTPVDLKVQAATPATTDSYWAYNFFPSQMPHIVLHFTSLTVTGEGPVTDKYVTIAKYSTSSSGGTGNEFTTAKVGNVYTLNVNISDYEKQITDLPESESSVIGYVEINIINWQGNTLYPEW